MGKIARELSQNRWRELSLQFESLAFVGHHISPRNTEISPHRSCLRCAAIRIAGLAFIRLTFVPRGTAEWSARVDRVRWTLAIGDWRFYPSKDWTLKRRGPLSHHYQHCERQFHRCRLQKSYSLWIGNCSKFNDEGLCVSIESADLLAKSPLSAWPI